MESETTVSYQRARPRPTGSDLVLAHPGSMTGPPAPPVTLVLRLYTAGVAPNSVLALANLESLLARHGIADYQLEIVDCISDPRRALRDGVLVTPTLVKLAPEPTQAIVGTLSDDARVWAALGIAERATAAPSTMPQSAAVRGEGRSRG